MSDSLKLGAVALECPNAAKLAEFYATITDGTVTYADDNPVGHPFCLCREN